MKKYLSLINLFLIIILFGFFFFLLHKFNSSLAIGVSHQQHNSVISESGMEWISDRLSDNFTLLVTTLAILFGLLSLFSYRSIYSFIMNSSRKLKREHNRYKHKLDKYLVKLKGVEGDLSFETARSLANKTDTFDVSDVKNYVSLVENKLVICDYYSRSLVLKSDISSKFKDSVSYLIKSHLKDIVSIINLNKDNIQLETLEYERYLIAEKNIKKVCDLEDKQNLAFMFSKLSFQSLS